MTFRDHLPCERLILEVHREAEQLPLATAINATILKDEQRGVIVILRVHEGGRSKQAMANSWDTATALRNAFAQLAVGDESASLRSRRLVALGAYRAVDFDRWA